MDWDRIAWVILIVIGYRWINHCFDVIDRKIDDIKSKLEEIRPTQDFD